MKIRPLHNWVVIRPDQVKEKTVGGLIIPDSAQEKTQMGEVLAIGPGYLKEEKDKKGKVTEKKFEATVVKPGSHVFYEKYTGNTIDVGEEELLMIREYDILGEMD